MTQQGRANSPCELALMWQENRAPAKTRGEYEACVTPHRPEASAGLFFVATLTNIPHRRKGGLLGGLHRLKSH